MSSAWNEAIADLAAARKIVAKAGSNEEALDKACDIELEAVWRVIKTPCPDWQAFAKKMAEAQAGTGDFFDGMTPYLVEEAQRLSAGRDQAPEEEKISAIDGAADAIEFVLNGIDNAVEHCGAEVLGPVDTASRIARQQLNLIREGTTYLRYPAA